MLYLIQDSIGFRPVLPEDVSSAEDKSNVDTSQSFCLPEWVYCGSKKAFYYFNIAWKLVSSKREGQTSGKVTTALRRSAADITILSSACLFTWCPDLTCAAITSSGSIRRPLECHWCLGNIHLSEWIRFGLTSGFYRLHRKCEKTFPGSSSLKNEEIMQSSKQVNLVI